MPAPDLIQQQRDILRDFRGCGQQRSHAERDALERLKAEIAKAEVAMNTARQHAETKMNKVMGNLKDQRDKKHKSARSIVDNIATQEKYIQQQMWFRNQGHCLACGQKLGLLENGCRWKV